MYFIPSVFLSMRSMRSIDGFIDQIISIDGFPGAQDIFFLLDPSRECALRSLTPRAPGSIDDFIDRWVRCVKYIEGCVPGRS